MYLYNSATHKKAEFLTHTPGRVEMYTCGPTVYHFAHIGNLRSYIMEDVLEKALRYEGYDVNRVMNITDVGHLSSMRTPARTRWSKVQSASTKQSWKSHSITPMHSLRIAKS